MQQFKNFNIIFGKSFSKIKYIIFILQIFTVFLETISIALLLPILHLLTGVKSDSKVIIIFEQLFDVEKSNILKILVIILVIFFKKYFVNLY